MKRGLVVVAIALPVTLGALWYAANHVPWFGAWLADTLRSVIGTDNVAELEEFAYETEDGWNRFWRADEKPKQYWEAPSAPGGGPGAGNAPVPGNAPGNEPVPGDAPSSAAPAAPSPSSAAEPAASGAAAAALTPFRPADIGPVYPKIAAAGDGIWVPVALAEAPTEAPLLYKTLLHPDARRPWAELFLVAIDLQRAQLFAVAGTTEPRGTAAGAKEAVRLGLVPEAQVPELVAGFNGGFKEEHGHYGMKIGGVLLVGPRKDACTIAALRDGSLRIAGWKAVEGIEESMVWWRQTPSCLIENGKLHPALFDENTHWGAAIGGATVVRRSAAGLDPARKVLYVAVSNSTSPRALAVGMQHSGAADVAQLDINYSYPRFVLFPKGDAGRRASTSLFEGFKVNEDDYLRAPSPRDFFYVTRKPPPQ